VGSCTHDGCRQRDRRPAGRPAGQKARQRARREQQSTGDGATGRQETHRHTDGRTYRRRPAVAVGVLPAGLPSRCGRMVRVGVVCLLPRHVVAWVGRCSTRLLVARVVLLHLRQSSQWVGCPYFTTAFRCACADGFRAAFQVALTGLWSRKVGGLLGPLPPHMQTDRRAPYSAARTANCINRYSCFIHTRPSAKAWESTC
jgi:hypothetical protein